MDAFEIVPVSFFSSLHLCCEMSERILELVHIGVLWVCEPNPHLPCCKSNPAKVDVVIEVYKDSLSELELLSLVSKGSVEQQPLDLQNYLPNGQHTQDNFVILF